MFLCVKCYVARNRTIYNTQAVYVSIANATGVQTGVGSIEQLSRVQNFEENFTRNFTDVNEYGELSATDRIEVESPEVTASFSYYLTNGKNDKNIGLNVYESGTSIENLRSCISGLLTKQTDEKNYYLLITEEGFDAANYVGEKSGVIGIGNAFLTSYSVSASVGEIPTADVEIEGLNVRVYGNLTGDHPIPAINPVDGASFNDRRFRLGNAKTITGKNIPMALQPGDIIFSLESNQVIGFDGADLKVQDFTLSFDLSRTPLQRLGERFAFSREINFPITATLEVNAEVGDLADGNLADLICSENKKDFTILMKEPGCETTKNTALAYVFKGAKLVSQNFSSSIGDNTTMSATYEVQVSGPQDTTKGIFISGSFTDVQTLTIEEEVEEEVDAGPSTLEWQSRVVSSSPLTFRAVDMSDDGKCQTFTAVSGSRTYPFISNDYGQTWKQITGNSSVLPFWYDTSSQTVKIFKNGATQMVVGPRSAAGSGPYLFNISYNSGNTWSVLYSSNNATISRFDASDDYKVMASVGLHVANQLSVTHNSGVTWFQPTNSPISNPGDTFGWGDISMSYDGKYILTNEPTAASNVYLSEDSGVSWDIVTLPANITWADPKVSKSGDIQLLADNNNADIYRSANYGNSWTKVLDRPVFDSWQKIDISKNNKYLLATTNQWPIYRSENSGVTWQEIDLSTFGSPPLGGIAISANGKYQIAIRKPVGTQGDSIYVNYNFGL